MPLLVPISVGELLDKISILELKAAAISDPAKRANVLHELAALQAIRQREVPASAELDALRADLHEVNRRIWEVEDELRARERQNTFDDAFVTLARSVYRNNDHRAAVKRRINDLTGSDLVEEKSYRSV